MFRWIKLLLAGALTGALAYYAIGTEEPALMALSYAAPLMVVASWMTHKHGPRRGLGYATATLAVAMVVTHDALMGGEYTGSLVLFVALLAVGLLLRRPSWLRRRRAARPAAAPAAPAPAPVPPAAPAVPDPVPPAASAPAAPAVPDPVPPAASAPAASGPAWRELYPQGLDVDPDATRLGD